MARKPINTTLDSEMYTKIQIIALHQSAQRNQKVNANDLLEEAMKMLIEKYETPHKS